jgi:tetratricopeptide (TPR) repeat protein
VGALGLGSLHAQAQKQWKDNAEYDLYNSIVKEQDASKKIALLNNWKQKYPASDYAPERLQFFLATYNGANQPDKLLDVGCEALSSESKNLTVLYLITLNAQRLTKPTADQLACAEQAGSGLISNLDTFFATDKKPAATSEADWKKARTDTEAMSQTALGWIGLQRKNDYDATEKHFAKSLELNPKNAQLSYWLGTAILAQKKPERQSEALYHFARAASLDPAEGGLAPEGRKTVDNYFTNAYNRFHGKDDAGLAELRTLAKASPMPAAGFKIKDINEITSENEKEFATKNPELAMWRNIKNELTGAGGEQYWGQMKGTQVPKFKAKLISMKPALKPKELVVSVVDGTTPDATLRFEEPLNGKVEPGLELEFKGVAAEYTKEPFMVTFDVERDDLIGWPKDTAPHRPATKKGAAAKKAATK